MNLGGKRFLKRNPIVPVSFVLLGELRSIVCDSTLSFMF